ncbi:MAG: dicarboxylate/amino acid:cation symporter [Gemmatimonadetes bacterium]|nr:dicarboxylate/amino acid:cation symporter [Gemmatimonadota bacterium]
MAFALKVLLGLFAGFAVGLVIAGGSLAFLSPVSRFLETVGTMWIAAIRMTVIPLVVSSLIAGVNRAPNPATIGRLGGRAVLFFVVMTTLAAVVAIAVGAPLMARISLDPAAVDALRATASAAGTPAGSMPTVSQWFIDLVPLNPVKSMADGAMLPLITFTLAFAIAITRVETAYREPFIKVVEAVQDATLRMVRWVIDTAPYGVFALAVPLAAKLGLSALGALAGYTVITCGVSVLFMAGVLYPAAALFGSVPVAVFTRAWLAPQAVAFSARSSMAALPAMIEVARDKMKLPASIHGFLIPLAASTFRPGAGVGQILGALFIARLYGIDVPFAGLVAITATALVTSFSVPGIPGGSIVAMVPVLMVVNLPVEGIGILLGVDTILDMFRTTTNTTGHLSAACVLAKGESEVEEAPSLQA